MISYPRPLFTPNKRIQYGLYFTEPGIGDPNWVILASLIEGGRTPLEQDSLNVSGNQGKRISENRRSRGVMREDLNKIRGKIDVFEQTIPALEKDVRDLQKTAKEHALQLAATQAKLTDMEDRSRRSNVRILGLPENVEAGDPIKFCQTWLVELFGQEAFSNIFGLERAHRVPGKQPPPDGRPVPQVEELMAVPGEELIIPCHYSLKTLGKAQQVTWYIGDSHQCVRNNKEIYTGNTTHAGGENRFSLVNFPEDISLRIHRVQGNGYRHFCCRVTTRTGIIKNNYATELTIAGSPSFSPFNVTQPYNMTGHRGESVTLSCSYTSYLESDVLGATIYWRLGNLSGPYVYHPYKEMVHPGYRGRTEITGAADLHIQGLQRSDDAMYYCFVMVRLCTGNEKYDKLIQYGGGTRLIVTDDVQTHLQSTDIFGIYIGFKIFISLVLFIVALFHYKYI
ncbi:uncharacterized protein [Dendropsophus ebraccatus]|uniref:uncharacterized protein n=1 Tax=Dendropsophus ebraccatus TaxID=150705 RepID=UPI003831B01F